MATNNRSKIKSQPDSVFQTYREIAPVYLDDQSLLQLIKEHKEDPEAINEAIQNLWNEESSGNQKSSSDWVTASKSKKPDAPTEAPRRTSNNFGGRGKGKNIPAGGRAGRGRTDEKQNPSIRPVAKFVANNPPVDSTQQIPSTAEVEESNQKVEQNENKSNGNESQPKTQPVWGSNFAEMLKKKEAARNIIVEKKVDEVPVPVNKQEEYTNGNVHKSASRGRKNKSRERGTRVKASSTESGNDVNDRKDENGKDLENSFNENSETQSGLNHEMEYSFNNLLKEPEESTSVTMAMSPDLVATDHNRLEESFGLENEPSSLLASSVQTDNHVENENHLSSTDANLSSLDPNRKGYLNLGRWEPAEIVGAFQFGSFVNMGGQENISEGGHASKSQQTLNPQTSVAPSSAPAWSTVIQDETMGYESSNGVGSSSVWQSSGLNSGASETNPNRGAPPGISSNNAMFSSHPSNNQKSMSMETNIINSSIGGTASRAPPGLDQNALNSNKIQSNQMPLRDVNPTRTNMLNMPQQTSNIKYKPNDVIPQSSVPVPLATQQSSSQQQMPSMYNSYQTQQQQSLPPGIAANVNATVNRSAAISTPPSVPANTSYSYPPFEMPNHSQYLQSFGQSGGPMPPVPSVSSIPNINNNSSNGSISGTSTSTSVSVSGPQSAASTLLQPAQTQPQQQQTPLPQQQYPAAPYPYYPTPYYGNNPYYYSQAQVPNFYQQDRNPYQHRGPFAYGEPAQIYPQIFQQGPFADNTYGTMGMHPSPMGSHPNSTTTTANSTVGATNGMKTTKPTNNTAPVAGQPGSLMTHTNSQQHPQEHANAYGFSNPYNGRGVPIDAQQWQYQQNQPNNWGGQMLAFPGSSNPNGPSVLPNQTFNQPHLGMGPQQSAAQPVQQILPNQQTNNQQQRSGNGAQYSHQGPYSNNPRAAAANGNAAPGNNGSNQAGW